MLDITVCIPTIPPREHLLQRAVASVRAQTLQPRDVIVECDTERTGAALTRDRALDKVQTEWVAFLDDDDELYPQHLYTLAAAQQETGADYLFSWFDVVGGMDPFPGQFGKQFDPAAPTQTTVTTMVRTSIAQRARFAAPALHGTPTGHTAGEDWAFTLRCVELGARFHHVAEKTWAYHHWGGNTSGMPDRWPLIGYAPDVSYPYSDPFTV